MIPTRQRPLRYLQIMLGVLLQAELRDDASIGAITSEILRHPELQQRVTQHARRVRPEIVLAPYLPDHKQGIPQRKLVLRKGKAREVWAPSDEDYLQQLYLLHGIVAPIAEWAAGNHSHAFRKGKSTYSATAQVITAVSNTAGQDTQIRQEDITGCFPNLPVQLGRTYWPSQIADTLEEIHIRYNEAMMRFGTRAAGLPQGYPIVPSVANIVIEHIIRPIRESYQPRHVTIVVYCDDITIVGPRRHATAAREHLSDALRSHGMNLHPGKSRIVYPRAGNQVQLLGFVLSWATADAPPTIGAKQSAYDSLTHSISESDTLAQAKSIIRGWNDAYVICNEPHHKTKAQKAIQDGYRKQSERANTRIHSPQ